MVEEGRIKPTVVSNVRLPPDAPTLRITLTSVVPPQNSRASSMQSHALFPALEVPILEIEKENIPEAVAEVLLPGSGAEKQRTPVPTEKDDGEDPSSQLPRGGGTQ